MKTKTIGFRVTEEFYELLKMVCEFRGEDISDFIRRAILKELGKLGYLPVEQTKALGIEETQ